MITAAGVCALATPAPAATLATDSTSSAAAIACPTDDLCLKPASGATITVRAGKSRTFDPRLIVDAVVNHTSLTYCVETGLIINVPLAPGASLTGTHTVYAVTPGSACAG